MLLAPSIFVTTLALAGVVLFVPSAVLLVECLAAWVPGRGDGGTPSGRPLRLAVLIPAHNESATLPATLAAVMPQLGAGDRALVVADNCTDDTAELARAAGARVLERSDAVRRGKGYALAAGIEQLAVDADGPPDVVVLLDADVAPPPGAIETLARRSCETGRPVQAVYLLHAPTVRSWRDVVSELAFLVKNQVRPLGLHRLGCPVLLTGTGIAVPWGALRRVDLASGDLVEDMKLGLDLLRAGHPPTLCPEVVLRGQLPEDSRIAHTQRTRWEQGHLSVIRRYAVPMLWFGLRRPGSGGLALGLDLLVPPLAMLVSMLFGVVVLTGLGVVWTGAWWAGVPVLAACGAVGVSVGLGYLRAGRHLPLRALLAVPFYVMWKLPMYVRAVLGKKETRWVRTARKLPDGESP